MDYLKPKQHYLDRYDLHTIEECLDYYWSMRNGMDKKRGEIKNLTDEEFQTESHKAISYTLNVLKIQRYRHKAETITKWMDRDKRMQETLDTALPPIGIQCHVCSSPTKVVSKDLMNAYEDDAYALFMFECIKCKKRQALLEDGTPWKHDAPKCPQCGSDLKSTDKDKKDLMITLYACSNCSYTKKDVYDFAKSRKEREATEKREKELLSTYRKEFCYDDTVGPKAVQHLDTLIRFADEMKAKEKKEADPIYQKAMKLKQLTVVELQRLLHTNLVKEQYINLSFDKPEMGKYVIVPFTVQDADATRKDYKSTKPLEKLIRKTLEGTNWNLMTDGTRYRLGYVYGRLKGLEQEEDLMEKAKEANT